MAFDGYVFHYYVWHRISWKALAAMYASGLPFNIVHGISTMVFLFFLAGPMERKLERIKKNMEFYKEIVQNLPFEKQTLGGF